MNTADLVQGEYYNYHGVRLCFQKKLDSGEYLFLDEGKITNTIMPANIAMMTPWPKPKVVDTVDTVEAAAKAIWVVGEERTVTTEIVDTLKFSEDDIGKILKNYAADRYGVQWMAAHVAIWESGDADFPVITAELKHKTLKHEIK